jgi:serine/threonine protein kinase
MTHGTRTLASMVWRDVPVCVAAPSEAALKSDKAAVSKALEREAVLLCRMRHPHVVALLAVRAGGAPGLVLQHSNASTLESVLATPGALASTLLRLRAARSVARALVYLHYVCKPAIVHRGVCPSAVLCNPAAPHDAKLACFDNAQPIGGDAVPLVPDDMPRWTAPELLSKSPYDARVDVYSFGVLLWQLLSGRVPFADAESARAVRARVQDGLRPDPALMIDRSELAAATAASPGAAASGTAALAGLAARAWSAQPNQRPTMADAAKLLSSVCSGVEKKDAQHEEDRQMCSVCLDQPRCMALVPCGHVATCENCAQDLRGHSCVICFAPSTGALKVFL